MASTIEQLVKQLSEKGLNKDELIGYIQGFVCGVEHCSYSLSKNKVKKPEKSSDPLFSHTINHVVDELKEKVDLILSDYKDELTKQTEEGLFDYE